MKFSTSAIRAAALATLLPSLAPAQTDYPRPYLCFPISSTALDTQDIVQVHNYVFGKGGSQDLHAEIAYPKKTAKPLPAIIYIHGGGWFAGDLHQGDVVGLARNGYFGVSIEYRLSDVAKWPAQIQDCKCAVRWLRANAAKFNVDPNRIGVWGASAGGHLVACVGTMDNRAEYEGNGGWPGVSSAVQVVCDMCGPTDFTRVDISTDFLLKCEERLLGCTLQQNSAAWKSASPFYDVKAGAPPFLVIQGDSDTIVNPQQAMIFDEALSKAGIPHRLLVVRNGGHEYASGNGQPVNPDIAGIQQAIAQFFAEHLRTP